MRTFLPAMYNKFVAYKEYSAGLPTTCSDLAELTRTGFFSCLLMKAEHLVLFFVYINPGLACM